MYNSIYPNNYGMNNMYGVNQIPQQQSNLQQPMYVPTNQNFRQAGLQGKIVDSIDTVKAQDIPLDFSVTYFPLADSSAIITKQLQQDGTSKIVIYKPTVDSVDKDVEKIQYVTADQLSETLQNIQDMKDEIKTLKKQIKTLAFEDNNKKGE